jgi:hypothetical protein
VVIDFEQRQARVLFMIRAQSTIVGTAPFHGRVVNNRHFRGLQEYLTATAIIVHVFRYQHALKAMVRATFQEIDIFVGEDDFGVTAAVALRADGSGGVVEEIGTDSVTHENQPLTGARRNGTSRQYVSIPIAQAH